MFQKIDQWLLTRYPLLWNMRLHLLLPLIIVVHVLFYISGYISSISLKTLGRYHNYRYDGSAIAMAALLAVLILVLWLVFYMRNNAFKNFYPLKKGRLFAEFMLTIFIVLGLSTFAISWQKGIRDRVALITQGTDLKKEAETVNLAGHFIAYAKESFDINSCCDSVRKHEQDTLPANDSRDVAITDVPGIYSYLYYCELDMYLLSTEKLKDKYEVNETANRWLTQNKQDSVRWVLDSYLALCKKYGAAYRFNAAQQVKEVFGTPDHRIHYTVNSSDYDRDAAYIEQSEVIEALGETDNARTGFWSVDTVNSFVYMAIYAAIILFSYRLTRTRTWFIAAIGMGLWALFFGLVAGLSHGDEAFMFMLFFTLFLLFFLYAIFNIPARNNKTISGLSFLWFLWVLPSVVPMFFTFLQKVFFEQNNYVYDQAGNAEYVGPNPHYEWIEGHWLQIHAGNFLFVLLMTALVIIPMARKWQANPEE